MSIYWVHISREEWNDVKYEIIHVWTAVVDESEEWSWLSYKLSNWKKEASKNQGFERGSKVMQTLDYVSDLYNCVEFSRPSSCLDEAV